MCRALVLCGCRCWGPGEGDSRAAPRSAAGQWEHASCAGMRGSSFKGRRRGAILRHPSRSAAGRATQAADPAAASAAGRALQRPRSPSQSAVQTKSEESKASVLERAGLCCLHHPSPPTHTFLTHCACPASCSHTHRPPSIARCPCLTCTSLVWAIQGTTKYTGARCKGGRKRKWGGRAKAGKGQGHPPQ